MIRRAKWTALSLLVAVAVAGCGSATGGGAARSSASALTAEDLRESNQPDVYGALERLRPAWLRPRGVGTVAGAAFVTVFVDGVARGEVSVLRSFAVSDVERVAYLTPTDAATRYGTLGGNAGTIVITLR